MALMRKRSVNVLRHLQKLVTDLEEIATLEDRDIAANMVKIDKLKQENEEHAKEHDLAATVAKNIKVLIGEKV